MSSFWEKRLGNAPAPRGPANPNLPIGMGGNQQEAVNDYMARQQLVQQQQPQPQYAPEEYEPPDPKDPYGHMSRRKLFSWRGNPKGGLKETMTVGNCPECGSERFFSRQNTGGQMTRDGNIVYPFPECMSCGYPRTQGELSADFSGMPVTVTGSGKSAQADTRGSWASVKKK